MVVMGRCLVGYARMTFVICVVAATAIGAWTLDSLLTKRVRT